MRLKLTLLAIAAQALSLFAFAQTDVAGFRYGAFADYSAFEHSSHFRQLPGVEFYNPYWNSKVSSSYAAGFLFESPTGKSSIFSLKLGLTREDGSFTASDTIDLPVGNSIQRTKLDYFQNTKIDRLLLEPAMRLRIADKLYVDAGLFAKFLLGSSFDRYESLPSAGINKFPDSTTSRFRKNGSIQSLQNITGGLTLGLSYDIPMDRKGRFTLSPHIIGNYSLTKNIQEIDWTTHSVRLGVSIIFAPPKRDQEERLPVAPPSEAPRKNDEELAERAASGERQRVTRLYPLLNYFFFDSNSVAVPARYVKLTPEQTASFTDSSLKARNALDIYYTSLNMIGYRMNKYPSARLTVTGCSSGRDESPAIGMDRAETIASYLADVWKISKKRIVTVGRDLPETSSRNVSGIGAQENRRVEISSNDQRILAPFVAYDLREEAPQGSSGFFPYAEEYALLLFDFEKSKLSERNLAAIELITNLMKPEQYKNLPPNEYSVRFLGYSDATGSPAYNEALARERAEEVRKLIPVTGSVAVGIGESILLFNNSTPEGRFYCRTVIVRAERKNR